MVSFSHIHEQHLKKLLEHGYAVDKGSTQYEKKRYIGPATLVLYKSGKLVVTGKDSESAIKVLKKIGVLPALPKGEFVGSDEALKGDTFGGMVVVGVFCDDKKRAALEALHVRDSKSHTHEQIHDLAGQIKKVVSFEIRNLYPEEYNKTESVTALLNRLHKEVFDKFGKGKHIVDKYPGCSVGDIRETKAESKYLEVAAASIIARDEGLHQMKMLEKKAGFKIPLGSTHVSEALKTLKEKGLDPRRFVKVGFKNVKKALLS